MSTFGVKELLECYRRGVFPMAKSQDDPRIYLFDPDMRGIIPLDGLHISRSLKKFMKNMNFKVTFDVAFREVMTFCAQIAPDRDNTWINEGIKYLYGELYDQGNAHSVEIWEDGKLVGGLYGVSIGAAFFGESMFSRRKNASKVALVALVERLNQCGYKLLDTQYITDHLETMGGIEISRDAYHEKLAAAIALKARFET